MKNKKWMKGIAITAIAAMSMGMLAGCGGSDQNAGSNADQQDKTYKIGIVQQQQHGSLDEAGLVVVCGADSMVKDGGTATYGFSYYQLGYNAGVMAAKILNGESVPAEMPIQYMPEEDCQAIINTDAVELLGIEIPADLLESATKVTTQSAAE